MRQFVFEIQHPGEPAAGIAAYADTVTVTVASGDPGGEPGEFVDCMRNCLAEWYDGAHVDLDPADEETPDDPYEVASDDARERARDMQAEFRK